jgi:hypothetical protein
MGTTAATFARIDPVKWANTQEKTAADIKSGTYEPDSIYVLDTGWALRSLLSLDPSRDMLAQVGGFNVLAPGYGRCGDCPPLKAVEISNLAVSMGTDILFNAAGAGAIFLLDGWSTPEPWGTWTEGKNSHLILPLPTGADIRPMRLSINARGLLGEGHPSQTVTVSANGVAVGQIHFDDVHNSGWRTLAVPLNAPVRGRQGLIEVTFEIERPVRPVDLGMSQDVRELGMGLIAMRLDAEP